MAYMDVKADHPERAGRRAAAREEFLRRHLAGHHRGADRGRLSGHRAGPDRLLQIHQAGALPVQLPAACRQHACPADLPRHRQGDHHRPFDRRHAGDALWADVSGRGVAACPGRPDRAGGLEGQGRSLAERRRLVSAGAANHRRPHPRATSGPPTMPARGSRITKNGCRCWPGCIAVPGRDIVAWNSALLYDMIFTQPVVYELGHLEHARAADDRRQGHHGDRQEPCATRRSGQRSGNYPVLGREAAAQMPNAKLVEFPDLGHAPQIQDPAASTRRCSTACASRISSAGPTPRAGNRKCDRD